MLTNAQVSLLSSLWQGLATFYGIIFVIYTVRLDLWMRQDPKARLDTARGYIPSFKAVLMVGLLTLFAVILCLFGLLGDQEASVFPATILSGAAVVSMFAFLLYEVTETWIGAELAAIFGDIRSGDPERKARALKGMKSINSETGEVSAVADMKIQFDGDPDADEDE